MKTETPPDVINRETILRERLQALRQRELPRTSAISKRPSQSHYALSFAQQRLWFIDQLQPGSPVYNSYQAVRLDGDLNVSALETAVSQIVSRHESLRTIFDVENGEPVQIIRPASAQTLNIHDLRGVAETERDGATTRILTNELQTPFDLSRDGMLRATLVKRGEREHILLFVIHHIASDAWSFGILFREIAAFYEAALAGREPQLQPLPIQYADFALWQRHQWESGALTAQFDFWKSLLSGPLTALDIPTDRPRPQRNSFRGGMQSIELTEGTSEALRALARREGVTMFMLMLAAFKAYLHRYTGQTDIIIGSPIAGRQLLETEPLVGLFVNTLVLRTEVSGELSFRELLSRVRETALGAFANQDVPFEKLVAELQPERTLGQNPILSVLFAHENPRTRTSFGNLAVSPLDMHSGTAKFDLIMIAGDTGTRSKVSIEFNADLFEPATIERMLGHFSVLLDGVVADAARRISQLPLLTDGERRQLVAAWNMTGTSYPRGRTLQQVFEEQTEQTPDATAAIFGTRSIRYRELNSRANQLAGWLQSEGVGKNVLVGVCLERSVEMLVAFLAVLKAGGAYVPLDPSYPGARLQWMLNDAGAPVLLTQKSLLHLFTHSSDAVATPTLFCMDRDWHQVDHEPANNPPVLNAPENLAYVMYTSGSTGIPKGVCVPHRAIMRLVKDTNYISLKPGDRIAQASNASFDAATFEIWGALLNGATMIGVPKDVMLSPRDFAQQLREARINTLFITTALFQQMVATVPDAFEPLDCVLFGGETVDPKSVAQLINGKPPKRLLHVYGPTENTTFSTWHLVAHVPENAATVPIGKPISNTTLYILDENLQPAPVGVPGEIFLGGDGLATGYWQRPQITAERFIANPFSGCEGDTLYRTGDLARFLPGGVVEFIGRRDQQVKIRGFRIELGEIESVLGSHPRIRECVVAAPVLGGERRLTAYVVPSNGSLPSAAEMRGFLRERIPDYMIPAAFMELSALPLTPNNKVNRSALPECASMVAAPEITAPRDETERQLVGIWESVLKVRCIGVRNNFFELGGHSLLAIRLLAEIETSFGRKLPVSTIFESPTVEQLASVLRGQANVTNGGTLVEVQGKGTRPPLFLVNGAGGGMFWGYSNLAHHLHDQPVYVLKSHGLDGLEELKTIEEIAAQFVAAVRQFQPEGPYQLGGYCFGGNVAFEMARQLEEQGQPVSFVGLMNCVPPNSCYMKFRWTPASIWKFWRNAAYWAGYFLRANPGNRREFLRWKVFNVWRKLFHMWSLGSKSPRIEVEDWVDASSFSPERERLWETHIRALLQFHPKPFGGRVVLFRNHGHPGFSSFAEDYGWSEFARGGVTVKLVPGAHESILEEPHVAHLSKTLEDVMNETQKPQRSVHTGCVNAWKGEALSCS